MSRLNALRSLALPLLLAPLAGLCADRVLFVSDRPIGGPAAYGLSKLEQSLTSKGLTVVRGPAAAGRDAAFVVRVEQGGSRAGREPQSLAISRTTVSGKPALTLASSDAVGLMYAALDTAERVTLLSTPGNPFAGVRETRESPYLAERGVSMYTMQRAYFDSRLHDENHWRRYFDLLAASRINAFTIIFGYENGGFMSPLYPYFFDLPQYPGVKMSGMTKSQQDRNAAALKRLIAIAHERGVRVIPAVWDHIYRGGVQAGGIAGATEMVSGVTADNLADYTKQALKRFFEVFPEIDGIEFRMHGESGLKRSEMEPFWHEVFGIIATAKPGLSVTLRAKELPDEIIADAIRQGLKARIETKYWMEQMGLPFHPTHVNKPNQQDRRHGYADLLKYPQFYRVHWRLWNGGTTRLLLWADPEYVRRYAESARLYGGNSIDVNEMLATWMLGEPHDKAPMPALNARYQYYDYPFERYWHFYQVWGRVSYNPATTPDVWQKEFERRFGPAGPSLMSALHTASSVLPHIVAAAYRYDHFPTTRGWAEMMRQGDLPKFAELEGTDIEQFLSPRDEARRLVDGASTSKRRPQETSRWFASVSSAILNGVQAAEAAGLSGNEALSTVTDLKILAALARYYSERLPAAVSYNLFRDTLSTRALDDAIASERRAVAAWAEIVKAAGDVYADELPFGVQRVGFPRHWKEELTKLEQGLKQLESERAKATGSASRTVSAVVQGADSRPPVVRIDPVRQARPGQDLRVAAFISTPSGVKSVRLRYRHVTQYEDYQTIDMTLDSTGAYRAAVPGSFIVSKWDLMFFVEVIDNAGNGSNHPDLDVESPYVIVPVVR